MIRTSGQALLRNPPRADRELVLRGVRAVLSRQIDRVPLTGWSASPILVGDVRLRLSLTTNEAELLEQRTLVSGWVTDGQFTDVAGTSDSDVALLRRNPASLPCSIFARESVNEFPGGTTR